MMTPNQKLASHLGAVVDSVVNIMLVLVKTQWRGRESGPTAPKRTGRRAGSIHVTRLPPTPSPSDTAEDLLERQQASYGVRYREDLLEGKFSGVGELRVLKTGSHSYPRLLDV